MALDRGSHMSLFLNLLSATLLVAVTFTVHFAGLVALTAVLRDQRMQSASLRAVAGQGAAILFVVFALFALHALQIWIYAGYYLLIGEFTALEPALYFSTTAFTTVGFGDLTLSQDWRMLSAAEAANGFFLISWSGAFLVGVSARMRVLEHNIERFEERLRD